VKNVTGQHATQVRAHLRSLEINECPLCGSDEGLDVGAICGIPEIGPTAATVENWGREVARSYLPVVPAMCLHCGYQFLFNSVKLGITHPGM
jgi:predicted Zn-ribbon and HTH transcriptional regulator